MLNVTKILQAIKKSELCSSLPHYEVVVTCYNGYKWTRYFFFKKNAVKYAICLECDNPYTLTHINRFAHKQYQYNIPYDDK